MDTPTSPPAKDADGGTTGECAPDSYLQTLHEHVSDAIDNWDKNVLLLSGGALAISFAFVKDIVTPEKMVHIELLFWAWMMWTLSICFVLASFFSSYCAGRKAMRQFKERKIYSEPVGGYWDWLTTFVLNPGSGFLFVVGVILIANFANKNLVNAANQRSTVVFQTNVVTSVTTTITGKTNK